MGKYYDMPLRVGTDCSGLDAPIWALKFMKVPFEHVFASEVDPYCVRTILANDPPAVVYGDPRSDTPDGDITRRDHAAAPPCDLYVCGFPCQPFSVAGQLLGTDDPRGSVFWACVSYIRVHRPKWFVLENVRNLVAVQGGAVFASLLRALNDVPGYTVSHSVLNTKDYGIPQSRRRLYIVGVRDADEEFEFPPPQATPSPPPEHFVDRADTSTTTGRRAEVCRGIAHELAKRNVPGVFFDQLHMQRRKQDPINKYGYPYAPCITCNSYHWNSVMDRRASVKELLALQGLPTELNVVVPDTAFRRQIGNAMSCNVLRAIFARLSFPTDG